MNSMITDYGFIGDQEELEGVHRSGEEPSPAKRPSQCIAEERINESRVAQQDSLWSGLWGALRTLLKWGSLYISRGSHLRLELHCERSLSACDRDPWHSD